MKRVRVSVGKVCPNLTCNVDSWIVERDGSLTCACCGLRPVRDPRREINGVNSCV